MLIRNSLKQIFRTPVRTVMFFLLLMLSTVLLATGVNLWQVSVEGIKEFESLFTTIGTVRQKESGTQTVETWNAGRKDYDYRRIMTYGEWVDPSVLDFQGADYIVKPRRRPFFGAYVPEYTLYSEEELKNQEGNVWLPVVEVRALTSGTADPIKVEVTDQFHVSQKLTGNKIDICDHDNPDPITLEAGKKYIFRLNGYFPGHNYESDPLNCTYEYYIVDGIFSTQCTEDGEQLQKESNKVKFDEVTPGFYETERGKTWMEIAKTEEMYNHTIPVQPTDKTVLLKAFFNKTAYVASGRDISEQEYEEGKDVCLVPEKLARYNGWGVGDKIELPLYVANYANAPIREFRPQGGGNFMDLLNVQNEICSVFDRDTYEIVGIYEMEGVVDDLLDGLANNEVIIPYNSVQNNWEQNIMGSNPMRYDTTSFEIPNGEIDSYMEAWKKQGNDQLEIKFYDKGYTRLKEGIENRQIMAYIFLAGGGVMTLLILLFFCNLFISRQEKRTAIERSMGMTKRQCTISLLSGLMLIVLLGAAAGGAVGFQVSKKVVAENKAENYYDDTFTNGYIKNSEEDETVGKMLDRSGKPGKGAVAAAVLVFFASGVIIGGYMKKQLENEPLSLLSRAEE